MLPLQRRFGLTRLLQQGLISDHEPPTAPSAALCVAIHACNKLLERSVLDAHSFDMQDQAVYVHSVKVSMAPGMHPPSHAYATLGESLTLQTVYYVASLQRKSACKCPPLRLQ